MVKDLVQKNPSAVNIKTNESGTALDIAENICYKGVDCSSVVEYLKTLSIHEAAKEGKFDVVKNLLKKNPAILDITNNQGRTPLYVAAMKGKYDVVKYLLEESQADAFVLDKHGWAPFHEMAQRGWLEMVKDLVQKNPSAVNVKTNESGTALDIAENICYKGADCSSVVEYLKSLKTCFLGIFC